jgi:hypothetical protein
MIELKITNSAALLLLTERMKQEFSKRIACKQYDEWMELENLSFAELLDVAESSAVDLICMLPADILLEKNNLDEIIMRAIRSLSGIYNKEDFNIYSLEKSRTIVRKVEKVFDKYTNDSEYQYN